LCDFAITIENEVEMNGDAKPGIQFMLGLGLYWCGW